MLCFLMRLVDLYNYMPRSTQVNGKKGGLSCRPLGATRKKFVLLLYTVQWQLDEMLGKTANIGVLTYF